MLGIELALATCEETNMNAQEIFEKVAAHLLSQNAQALDKGGNCLYRDPSGKACAVGCLIPDGHPALTEDNGSSVEQLLERHPDLKDTLCFKDTVTRLPTPPTYHYFDGADMESDADSPLNELVANCVGDLGLPGMFLYDLQALHDISLPHEWADGLREFAKLYNLSLPSFLQPKS